MQVTRIDQARATRGNPSSFDGEVNVQTLVSSTGEEPEFLAVFFNPGARTFPHVHEHDQSLHIIAGKGIKGVTSEKRGINFNYTLLVGQSRSLLAFFGVTSGRLLR